MASVLKRLKREQQCDEGSCWRRCNKCKARHQARVVARIVVGRKLGKYVKRDKAAALNARTVRRRQDKRAA